MRPRTSPLAATLWLVAAGILLQGALAGFFLSGTANLRSLHGWIGWILPFLAVAPAVLAHTTDAGRSAPAWVRSGTVALPIVLWVQEMLGHAPLAFTTAIHVPLGVALFGLSVALATAAGLATRHSAGTPPTPLPPPPH